MKQHYLLLLVFGLLFFTSCLDDNENSEWREANEEAYKAIENSKEWTAIYDEYSGSAVYYKVIEKGDGTESPESIDVVNLLYKGWFYNNSVLDEGTSVSGEPIVATAGQFIPGFSMALLNMKKGDVWQICIPYDLGYGRFETGKVPGYSTLFFEIELVRVLKKNI